MATPDAIAMDFRILGPLEVVDGDRTVSVGGSKQRALLAVLLLHANETLSTDRLIEELWAEGPPATAAKTVQVHVSRLRKALAARSGGNGGVVMTRDHGYQLRLDPGQLDADRFERLVAEGRAAARPEDAIRAVEQALALWRGAPLGEFAYELFAQREIARLDDLRSAALEHLIEAKLACGHHAEVVGQLEELIAQHPYRERLRAQLMVALYRSDRQADALEAYQDARRALVEGLGIDPGERLRQLELAILAQDPALRLADDGPGVGQSPQGSTPSRALLERAPELNELRAACEGALNDHGRLVVVEGAAGTGKSALMAAAAEQARAASLCVLTARGGELERGLAYGAIRQLFEVPVTTAPPAERAALLAGSAEPAARVVMPASEDQARAGADAGFGALHGIYWLTTNLSLGQPLLLVVDDLHWVDGSSVQAIAYLARRIADLPVALVVALRPDEPGTPVDLLDQLRAEPGAVRIALRPLQPESAAALVRASIPGADDALCSAYFQASAGNPFYLQELIRATGTDRGDGDRVAAVRTAALPAIGDRVVRRIARLGPNAAALARAMAVLDDGGRLADAAALAGIDEEAAATAASRMKRIEVLADEDPFAFAHPLVRRSVYDALSVTERDEAHTAAAVRLRAGAASAEAVASHLAAVRPAGSAPAATALRDAGSEAMRRAAPEAAKGWLRRALDENAAEPPRTALLHELARVELFGRDPAAIAHLQEARRLAEDPVLRARIGQDLAEISASAGQWEAAIAVGTEALADLGGREPELAVELEAWLAIVREFDPRFVATFERDRERLFGLAQGDGWGARALSVLLASDAAARGEGLDRVRPLVEQGLRDGRLLAERGAGGYASAHAIVALLCTDDHDRAIEVADDVAAVARRAGAPIGSVTAMIARSGVHTRRGDLAAAEADLRAALDTGMHLEMPLILAGALVWLTDLLLERPSLADFAALVETTELDPAFLGTISGAMLLGARGELRLARGERASAVADLRGAAAINRALGFAPTYAPWRSVLALALPADARDEARALVDEELALAAATGLPRPHGIALRASGLVAGGEEGIARLQDSVDALESSGARLEYARSLVELGGALRRRGQRAQAGEQLAVGLELAHAIGAERLAARAVDELRAAGGRPQRPARTGADALTPSEQRVARLAIAGRSNPEIAQELFVSLKTIETHLSHVYAKLGLSGAGARQRLAEQLPPG